MTTTKQTSVKTGKAFTFETMTCGRCGGTGHYSYCQTHGTTCFGCNGHGIKLTKRGLAAHARYTESLSARARDIKPGDKIFCSAGPMWSARWATVDTVKPNDDNRIEIQATFKDGTGWNLHALPESMVRVARTAEFKVAAKAEALAYQATLAKAGTPRKGA